jgi:hypothetical protein
MQRIFNLISKVVICLLYVNIAFADGPNTVCTDKAVCTEKIINKSCRNHLGITGGVARATTGLTQVVKINTTAPSAFTARQQNNWGGLFGLSLLRDYKPINSYLLTFGLSAFYLDKTKVKGEIWQARVFNNLAYRYDVSNIPVYIIGKIRTADFSNKVAVFFDGGIGPNFMDISNYTESQLNLSTRLENAYKGKTNTTLSATVSFGIHINNVIGEAPLEIGYRLFYLGTGKLQIINNQYATRLSTGPSWANALTCSLII